MIRLRPARAEGPSPWVGNDLVRAELFSAERLEQHGESLAKAQLVAAPYQAGHPVFSRVRDNYRLLLDAHNVLSRANADGELLTPASQWLVDNYHVVAAQIREIHDDLPPGYYRQLPKLAIGPFAGYPRVLGIAWAFVAHTDSRFDTEMLRRFLRAYQRVQPLTIGELWAVAITLRIVLVENLRRAATRILNNRTQRKFADQAAQVILGADGALAAALRGIVAKIPAGPLHRVFAVQLVQRLRDQDPEITPALVWLEQQLEAEETTADALVHEVLQEQSAMSVTVRNVITSMRMISTVDWTELFENVSLVDAALRGDSDFARMDFATRNRYRTAIEELARGSQLSELDITREALRNAWSRPREQPPIAASARQQDPGYYLIGDGRREFEATISYRPPMRTWLRRIGVRLGLRGYVGSIATLTLATGAVAVAGLAERGLGAWSLLLFGGLAILPAADAAVALVNRAVTSWFPPAALPALALRDGVPADLRTLVVVPTLLTSHVAVAEQIERLEIHYLASPDGHVSFALLTDWTDAPNEAAADDSSLLQAAIDGIARLNCQYFNTPSHASRPDARGPADPGDRFLLLHRRRQWNAAENVWMGWERKRGKLHELNRLLRGAVDTSFLPLQGKSPKFPAGVRYVITLDSDTRLPRDTVCQLIGKMAHPLNQPVMDPVLSRVVAGHGILQPRVTPSLPVGTEASWFQYAFSAAAGIDPYSAAISDVYQDLFDEGSFAGKGIYDLDVFEQALAGRVPDNTMLSHDLFEGIFARAGFASDVEVIEEFPARYDVALSRQHRWTRGDWQLLPWIFNRKKPPLPIVGRWKMLDNLRRSLTTPSLVLGLLCGWWLNFDAALFWTGFLLLTILFPHVLPVLSDMLPRRANASVYNYLRDVRAALHLAATQVALMVCLLAEQAVQMTDAVVRTLVRLFITRRHLLEWQTAEQATSRVRQNVAGHYRQMSGTIVVALAALAVAALGPHGVWRLAVPFACVWLLAPAITWWASRALLSEDRGAVSVEELQALRLIARRTWRYFEKFVTAEDHFLPPDNFQENPKPVVAHRTSPTNIGLYLLSVVAARDFGWIGLADAIDRLETTLNTMDRLERYNGHFLNWYDTTDLHPLDPKYVSSVDSGNLAGHLITLANACEAWANFPQATLSTLEGLGDALAILRQTLLRVPAGPDRLPVQDALDRLSVFFEGAGGENAPDEAVGAQLARLNDAAVALNASQPGDNSAEILLWAETASQTLAGQARDVVLFAPSTGTAHGDQWTHRLRTVASRARDMAEAMQFEFLIDPERKLLSIGFRTSDGSLDPSCYDLLASEARLASFVAIATNEAPVSHWFRLGRLMTPIGRGAALMSWSGSMFEYLMPSLVMRAPTGSLLATTNRMIVRRQMTYAAAKGVPWGMSESAFNARDLEFTYQYSNFGIPDLALKRGLGESIVIAPYATALAAMVDARAAAHNFVRLTEAGGLGAYGFYEALDYTPARVPDGQKAAIVRAYMAHHQGMSIIAILNALQDGIMRSRFHTEPRIQATELLLQERTPRNLMPPEIKAEETGRNVRAGDQDVPVSRFLSSPHGAAPATHLLSNGRYSVMVTASGSGYSHWKGLAITRWKEDAICDDWGSYVFLHDIASHAVWSAGYQPTGVNADSYEVTFTEERVEIARRDGTLLTTTEIVVSAEDDAEVRRLTLTNTSMRAREIEATSYLELALAAPADDAAHPVFSKLFVQTEYLPELGILLATRRRRSPTEPEIWAAHLVVVEGETIGDLHVETDRAAFLGRGRGLRRAAAMERDRPLTGSVGTVLDPIFSLRRRMRIAPGATVHLAFWTMVAQTRNEVMELADRHRDRAAYDRAFTLAWTQAQVQLRHIAIKQRDAARFQRLAGHMIYASSALRPSSEALRRGGAGPALLWAHGISGDLPILLVRIDAVEEVDIVRQLLQAHEYWRMKQFAVDLVILNEKSASYNQDLQLAIDAAVRMGQTRIALIGSGAQAGHPQGRVYQLRADLVPPETQALLASVARVVLISRRGTLADQLDRLDDQIVVVPGPVRLLSAPDIVAASWPEPELEFFNGQGGFAAGGREYVTILRDGQTTPAPWTNVIANPSFGFQVTADGGGYSWWQNSRENQLTPWSNDPVGDRPGDILYLRDEESGSVWGPTALPIRLREVRYQIHHGMGYSRFRNVAHGIESDLLQFVPVADPVKISRLTLRNVTKRTRRLSVTGYVEWVLGPSRAASAPMIVTERDAASGAILARNPWNTAYGSYVAFAAMPGRDASATGDRREFIGRNGTIAWPAALERQVKLSNRMGAGLDPCAVLQTGFELHPGESLEIVLLLGATDNVENAQRLIAHYSNTDLNQVMAEVTRHWETIVGATQVKTPDRAMDILLNGWLLYQTLACRVWARAGFYQASGAFGFRDQLQDGMALAPVRPDLTRAHLLRAAARQFPEGDVQHWWLPPLGQGVRTRISDDRVWLAYATSRYLTVTADHAVLDEAVPFLEGPVLGEHEHENYFQPSVSTRTAPLFEHCALGLDHALETGVHGLPLIGTGDWNDGMSRVGEAGKGESVWLAWFLYAALQEFTPLAEARGDMERAGKWRAHAAALRASVEREAWDGGWYRRGYYDDGTPLGSAASSECRIDAIAQSWAVISRAAEPARAARAMAAVDEHLVRRHDGIALLFTPPFDHTPLDPGYIKGYPPGIRENGGQYTHAGIWTIIALAMRGDGDRAAELFAMLNPINHARTAAESYRYKVEPYVIAADIYGASGHVGRGGWTWYTGSAGWMYRAGIEWILGLQRRGEEVWIDPCVPKTWPRFEAQIRCGAARYEVSVENPQGRSQGISEAWLDENRLDERPVRIRLVDDGKIHIVRLIMGEPVRETPMQQSVSVPATPV